MMNLKEEIYHITGIKPREAFDECFYLDFGENMPEESSVDEISKLVKNIAKKHGYSAFCTLHDQPSNYTLFCDVE